MEQDTRGTLAVQAIEQALGVSDRCRVETVAATGSTNDDLVKRAREQQPASRILRAADHQTRGRGRQQRAWHAARGDAVLFSVAVPLGGVPRSISAVTLACGVALADTLAHDGIEVRLKWPNDLRVNGRKLAGILSELVNDRAARYTLVVGVGVNLRLTDGARDAIGQPATALDELLAVPGQRECWIGRLGSTMIDAIEQFVRDGFEPFRVRFNERLEARGSIVRVECHTDAPAVSGRMLEVDRDGRLVIESGGVLHRLSVGDVSIGAEH